MRILFVDDEPENVRFVRELIKEVLQAEVEHAETIREALAALHREGPPVDLVVSDVFIPLGDSAREVLGLRARRAVEGIEHLGGLVLLDEIERLDPKPIVLIHTACTDYALFDLIKEHGHQRVPKPAPVDALLREVLEALGMPTPG